MRKFIFSVCVIMLISVLGSCGDTTKLDNIIEKNEASLNDQASDKTKSESAGIQTEYSGVQGENEDTSAEAGFSLQNEDVDVDLTKLEGTMVYAQVYDIINYPENYNGKKIRASGPFNYFKDARTGNEYFAVLIADATACCAQGIEFRLDGEHSYPEDYPEMNTIITICGECDVYKEDNVTYCQLLHAEYEVNKKT